MPLQATVTVTVVGGGLVYTITGDGLTVTPKKHRVEKGTQVEWICPDGSLGVLFCDSPFTTNETVLQARQNISTGFRKTKNKKKTYKYAVTVSVPGIPDLFIEDPDLDVSDDGGGGLAKSKKKPAKKTAPKKKRK
jgi:hypothetical protein